jgi:hypothetical protein
VSVLVHIGQWCVKAKHRSPESTKIGFVTAVIQAIAPPATEEEGENKAQDGNTEESSNDSPSDRTCGYARGTTGTSCVRIGGIRSVRLRRVKSESDPSRRISVDGGTISSSNRANSDKLGRSRCTVDDGSGTGGPR